MNVEVQFVFVHCLILCDDASHLYQISLKISLTVVKFRADIIITKRHFSVKMYMKSQFLIFLRMMLYIFTKFVKIY